MSLLLKSQVLISLCTCNVFYTVLRTEAVRKEDVPAEDVIMLSELFKLLFCVFSIFMNMNLSSSSPRAFSEKISWLVGNSLKMGFVAFVYFIMNLLSFLNFDYIGAGEFSVFAQAKILFTALFSVVFLGTRITCAKWRALFLLCIGCILVASPVYNVCPESFNVSNTKQVTDLDKITGYFMVLLQTALSGVANIYFEKVVKSKEEQVSIWERNFQLSVWSMLFCVGSKLYREESIAMAFGNWGIFSAASMLLGIVNGLLIALTLKHCDSVLKTIAQSSSIVFCTLLGSLYQNESVDSFVVMGCIVTIIAVSNYTFDTDSTSDSSSLEKNKTK